MSKNTQLYCGENNRTSGRGTFSSVPERKLSRRRLVGFLSLPRHSGCENARVTGSEFACSSLGGSGIGCRGSMADS